MSHNTRNGLLLTMSNKARNSISRTTAAVTGASIALSPALAFAQASGDFDGTQVVSKIVTYTAVGVTILAAYALGKWTLKALGIIGGR